MLQLPPTVQRRGVSGVGLIGDSKFVIGVNVRMNSCLSLCVSPASSTMVSWDRFQPGGTDRWMERRTDRWQKQMERVTVGTGGTAAVKVNYS